MQENCQGRGIDFLFPANYGSYNVNWMVQYPGIHHLMVQLINNQPLPLHLGI